MPVPFSLKGYTYQQCIYMLCVALMDAKREITMIDAEALMDDEPHNFDDICLKVNEEQYVFQTKNYPNTKYEDISINSNCISINSNNSIFSKDKNNIFVVNTEHFETTGNEILGIQAEKIENVYLAALPFQKIESIIENLYEDKNRAYTITKFAYQRIIDCRFKVTQGDLPPLIRFSIDLEQKTVLLRAVPEKIEYGIQCIIGRPGVGKSHYVEEIIHAYPNSIVYRFWIGSQDENWNHRLFFSEFLKDIALEIFKSPKKFTKEQLIEAINNSNRIIIIDGLDHIENYNNRELEEYFEFISSLNKSRVIVLSRPLVHEIPWKTVELENWDQDETLAYLSEAHNINSYLLSTQIYKITNGYPIITYFFAEHYKKTGTIIFEDQIKDVFDYYDRLLDNVRMKDAISIFKINNSFLLAEEIATLCNNETLVRLIKSFIQDYPYLFKVVSNRISLIHDSLNTYLKMNSSIDYDTGALDLVKSSILNLEIRYLSRFQSFNFDASFVEQVMKRYCSLDVYEKISISNFDYASIQEFYAQIRKIVEYHPNVLNEYQYYSLIFIYLLVTRNDMIQEDALIYEILSYGNNNGINEKEIFSNGYLWNSYLLLKYEKESHLIRFLKERHYGSNIEMTIESYEKEHSFFNILTENWDREKAWQSFVDYPKEGEYQRINLLVDFLVGLYIHKFIDEYLYKILLKYIDNNEEFSCIEEMKRFCESNNIRPFFAKNVLAKAQYKLWELDVLEKNNIFANTSVKELIKANAHLGSFEVREILLSYIRLMNFRKKEIDINSLALYWNMYYNHKDYSIATIQKSLMMFEKRGLIKEKDSLDMIIAAMEKSDEGIRDLLLSYINSKDESIINRLYGYYSLDQNFRVNYFELNPTHISALRQKTIIEAIFEHIRYGYSSKTCNFRDIENVLDSDYKDLMIAALSTYDFTVYNVPKDKTRVFCGINYELEQQNESREKNPLCERGYIEYSDLEYIVENDMSAIDISKYTDGWYSCFPYVELYQSFKKEDVKKQFLDIIHSAIYSKIHSLKSTGYWYYCADNMLSLGDWCEFDWDWNELFSIFCKFIRLSFIPFLNDAKDC